MIQAHANARDFPPHLNRLAVSGRYRPAMTRAAAIADRAVPRLIQFAALLHVGLLIAFLSTLYIAAGGP